MIIKIRADFSCDQCGEEFHADIEPSAIATARGRTVHTAMKLAEDAIKADGYGSIENSKHYCRTCTRKRDAAYVKRTGNY